MEKRMVSRDDLESFLIRLDLDYEEIDEAMFLVRSGGEEVPIVVHLSPPLLILRLKVMDLPGGADLSELYRTLLVLNATDIVHGSYGIEDGDLILSDTMELEALTFNQFQASMESLQMAASSHMERIRTLASAVVEGE
jgi:hypothetical protein